MSSISQYLYRICRNLYESVTVPDCAVAGYLAAATGSFATHRNSETSTTRHPRELRFSNEAEKLGDVARFNMKNRMYARKYLSKL